MGTLTGSGRDALAKAVYAALTGNANLMTLITGVYDHVPESTDFPYVGLGDITENEAGVFDHDYWDCTVTIHAWSNVRGDRELNAILKQINLALDRVTLSLADGSIPYIKYTTANVLPEPGPGVTTRHLVARYRAVVAA